MKDLIDPTRPRRAAERVRRARRDSNPDPQTRRRKAPVPPCACVWCRVLFCPESCPPRGLECCPVRRRPFAKCLQGTPRRHPVDAPTLPAAGLDLRCPLHLPTRCLLSLCSPVEV